MRHRKSFNHLGRTSSHRKAMLSNMASSLIKNKRINTTVAKAKALREYVEPLITKAKNDTTHSRRVVFSYLQDKFAVTELFREVSAKIGDRPGGYTRIIKMGNRLGDNADMAMIELVDYNENLLAEKTAIKTKTTRRRRGGKKKATPQAETTTATTTKVEEVAGGEPESKTEEIVEKVETAKAEVKAEKTEKPADEINEEKVEAKVETTKKKEVKAAKPEIKKPEEKSQAATEESKTEEPGKEVKAEEKEKPAQPKKDKKETEEGTEAEEKK